MNFLSCRQCGDKQSCRTAGMYKIEIANLMYVCMIHTNNVLELVSVEMTIDMFPLCVKFLEV